MSSMTSHRTPAPFGEWFEEWEGKREAEGHAEVHAACRYGYEVEGGRVLPRPIVPAQVPGSAIARDYTAGVRRMQR